MSDVTTTTTSTVGTTGTNPAATSSFAVDPTSVSGQPGAIQYFGHAPFIPTPIPQLLPHITSTQPTPAQGNVATHLPATATPLSASQYPSGVPVCAPHILPTVTTQSIVSPVVSTHTYVAAGNPTAALATNVAAQQMKPASPDNVAMDTTSGNQSQTYDSQNQSNQPNLPKPTWRHHQEIPSSPDTPPEPVTTAQQLQQQPVLVSAVNTQIAAATAPIVPTSVVTSTTASAGSATTPAVSATSSAATATAAGNVQHAASATASVPSIDDKIRALVDAMNVSKPRRPPKPYSSWPYQISGQTSARSTT